MSTVINQTGQQHGDLLIEQRIVLNRLLCKALMNHCFSFSLVCMLVALFVMYPTSNFWSSFLVAVFFSPILVLMLKLCTICKVTDSSSPAANLVLIPVQRERCCFQGALSTAVLALGIESQAFTVNYVPTPILF